MNINKYNLSLKYKIKHSRYNLYSYIKHLYRKHDVYNKIISSKYNYVHRFLVYLEFKGIIKDKHNQVNQINDIEYIKNVMQSIITKYE